MMGQQSLVGPTSGRHRAQLILASSDDFLEVLVLQLLHHQDQLLGISLDADRAAKGSM